jgi:hypothetical protein
MTSSKNSKKKRRIVSSILTSLGPPQDPPKETKPIEALNPEANSTEVAPEPYAIEPPKQEIKDSQDIVEKAMMILADRRANERNQKQIESKKEEEKGKENDDDEGMFTVVNTSIASS